ncbi:MAG: hypothetical protein KAG99_03520 [Bacteroidales bacterium]|nr:hypothetical protein [Bacteroidales bacterium]
MKKIDKLKHQRYEISMKIIELETKMKRAKLSKNEEEELRIIKDKEEQLNQRIQEIL